MSPTSPMSSWRLGSVLSLLVLAACATGEHGGTGEDGAVTEGDAAAGDGPEVDAPVVDIDAPTPPPIDAAAIADAAIDAAAIDAATIDAAPTDAAATDAALPIDGALPVDAGIDAAPGPIDTCAQALDLTAAAMGASGVTVTGSTVGYANNVQVPTACTAYGTLGPDAIYTLTVGAGRIITATATPTTSWDISIYLASTCSTTATCNVGDDSSLSGVAENVSFTTTAAGTYYLVIDGWSASTSGPYSLNVRVQ